MHVQEEADGHQAVTAELSGVLSCYGFLECWEQQNLSSDLQGRMKLILQPQTDVP